MIVTFNYDRSIKSVIMSKRRVKVYAKPSSDEELESELSTDEDSTDDDDDNYEVEAILAHKFVGRNKTYLIKWKGYPDSENCWIAEKNMACPEIIEEYERRLRDGDPPTKPKAKTARLVLCPPVSTQPA